MGSLCAQGGDTAYRKRTLGSTCSLWGAGGGSYGMPIQNGCHKAAQVWATETAGVSSQGGLTQGWRVQEGQNPGSRWVWRMNRTQ